MTTPAVLRSATTSAVLFGGAGYALAVGQVAAVAAFPLATVFALLAAGHYRCR